MCPQSQSLPKDPECSNITICRSYIKALYGCSYSIRNNVKVNHQNQLLFGSNGANDEIEIAGFEGLDEKLLENDAYIKNRFKLLHCRRPTDAYLQKTSTESKAEIIQKDMVDCLSNDSHVDYLAKNLAGINLECTDLPDARTRPKRSLVQTCLNLLERGVQLKRELQDHMKLSLFKLKNNYTTVKNAASAPREAHLMYALKLQWFEDMEKYSELCEEEVQNAEKCMLLAQEFEKIVANLMKSDKREFHCENASCR